MSDLTETVEIATLDKEMAEKKVWITTLQRTIQIKEIRVK